MTDLKVTRIRRVLASEMLIAEAARQTFCVTAAEGTTLEDLLKPQAWSHVAKSLHRGCRLDVTAADGSWYAELLVRGLSGLDIHIGVLRETVFDKPKAKDLGDYEIKYINPQIRYRVIRVVDKAIMAEGLISKEAAEAWVATPPTLEPLRFAA